MKEFYENNKKVILPAIIFIAVFLLFSPILANDFVYDDIFLVVINRNIQNIANPVYYFTHGDALRPYDPENLDIYRPLSVWFLAIEHLFFGMDSFYFHLVNLVLHAVNTVLFFFLLKKFIKNDAFSLVGALLFGFHPVTTETVAWVNQQTALWSWFFSFAVLIIAFSELNRILNKTWKKILTLVILSFAAAFSKEQAVILPLIYLLCLLYFKLKIFNSFKDLFKSGLREFWAITFSALLYLLFRAIFLGSFVQQEPWGGGRYSMFLTMINGFAYYLKLLIWPYPLSVNYDSFPIARSMADSGVIFSALILALIISMAIALWRRLPLFSLGIFWIFTVLLPVSNFILPTKQIINERFLYFALPGFIISMLSAFNYFVQKQRPTVILPPKANLALGGSGSEESIPFRNNSNIGFFAGLRMTCLKKHSNILQNVGMFFERKWVNYILQAIPVTAAVLILITFSTITFMRLGDWKNELTLWEHEVAIRPNDWRNQKNYAFALETNNKTIEAIKHYEKSLKLAHNKDLFVRSANALSLAHIRAEQTKNAFNLLANAIKVFPAEDAFIYTLGQVFLKEKKYTAATRVFNDLWQKNNDDMSFFFKILSKKLDGQSEKNMKLETEKIKNPVFRRQAAVFILAREKMLEENWKKAAFLLTEALKNSQPPILEPYLWLAESFEKSGEKEKALAVYDLTLSLYPLSIDALQGIKRLEQ